MPRRRSLRIARRGIKKLYCTNTINEINTVNKYNKIKSASAVVSIFWHVHMYSDVPVISSVCCSVEAHKP